MRKRGGGCWDWSPCFFRPFNDWEMDEVENLLLCSSGKSVVVDVGDRVRWGESKDDTFSVKAPYKALELESTGCFPMKIIWNSCVTKSKFR